MVVIIRVTTDGGSNPGLPDRAARTLTPGTSTDLAVIYNRATIGAAPAMVVGGEAVRSVFRLGYTTTEAAAINEDGTLNGPSHPAPVGSIIAIYGTGFGQTQLPGVSGTIFHGVPSVLATAYPVTLAIQGIAAKVWYAGAAPLVWAGIDQVNVQIPEGAPAGEDAVTGAASGAGPLLTIWVK